MKGFGAVLLSVACWYLIIKAVSSITVPFTGPNICRRICQQTVGCFSVKFSAKYLSCKLPFQNTSASEDTFLKLSVEKDKDSDVTGLNMSCPFSAKKFVSRNHLFLCRVPRRVRLSKNQQPWSTVQASLLMFQPWNPTSPMRQVFLNNRTSKVFSLSCKMINTLHYIKPNRFVSVCGYSRLLHIDEFVGTHFNAREKPLDTKVTCVAVAEDRIFYTRSLTLKQMTLEGTNRTVIKKLDIFPKCMVSDPKRSVLYITDRYGMRKFNYDGKKVVFWKVYSGPMVLGPHDNTLYIARISTWRQSCIYNMSLTDYQVHKLVCYPRMAKITSLFAFNGNLYSVTRRCEALFLEPDCSGEINLEKNSDVRNGCYGALIPHSAFGNAELRK